MQHRSSLWSGIGFLGHICCFEAVHIFCEVSLDALIRFTHEEAHVFLKHSRGVGYRIGIARQFVASLCAVLALPFYFGLPLPDEFVTDLVEHWQDYFVEEVMALDVEIGGGRGDAQACEVIFQALVAFGGVGVALPQLLTFLVDLTSDGFNDLVGVADGEGTGLDDAQKVGHGELVVMVGAVVPDVPYEERIDGL